MKTLVGAVVLIAVAGPACACQPGMLPVFPDVKEIAECVKSHEDRIALQQETLDRWMGLHKKLADLVFRQQEEVAKLKDEVFELKAKLSIQQKKR